MSDVVRHGKIIIDLEMGKIAFKAPDLRDLLAQLERELELVKQTERAQRELNSARQSGFSVSTAKPTLPPEVAAQLPPSWGGTAKPGGAGAGMSAQADAAEKAAEATKKATEELDAWAAGIDKLGQSAMPQVDKWAAGMARMAEQTAAAGSAGAENMARLSQQSDAAGKALLGVADGSFRIARGLVLLGTSSDESFQKMIQGLAMVQAGFDLFKGATKIVGSLEKAKVALAAATALNAAATTAETAAKTANTPATTRMAAADYAAAAAKKALAAATNPVVLGIVAITAAVMAAAEAYDYLTESAEESAEKQKSLADTAQVVTERFREQAAFKEQVAELQRAMMDDAAKANSLAEASKNDIASGRIQQRMANGASGDEQANYLGGAQAFYADAASKLEAEKQIREQTLATELKKRDVLIDQIKSQEKLVAAAREQLAAEKEKVTTFQAQMGQLTQQQQNRLRDIRDKLLAGQDISKFEEKFLGERGGDPGAEIVRRRQAKRGAAAGFDENFFAGIDGGEKMADDLKSAAKELAEAAKKLAELTNGQTAAAKIAELEAEKDKLREGFADYTKEFNKQMSTIIGLLAAVTRRLDELGFASMANR